MVNDMMIMRSVVLNAAPERVWEALTHPGMTRHYLGDYEFNSDLRPGGYWRWTGQREGRDVRGEGKILKLVPGQLIQYSGFDRMVEGDISRGGNILITHELVPVEGKTRLLTTLENFEGDETRAEMIANQWDLEIMPRFKNLVETGL